MVGLPWGEHEATLTAEEDDMGDGRDIDITKFPVPLCHEGDGGP